MLNCLAKASWIGISIITRLEFLAYTELSKNDKDLFEQLLLRIEVIDLSNNDSALLDWILTIRHKYKVKLPDAIIVSSAIENRAILITEDKQLNTIKEVSVVNTTKC